MQFLACLLWKFSFPRIIQKANLLILKCNHERNSLCSISFHFYSLPPLVTLNNSMLFHFLLPSGCSTWFTYNRASLTWLLSSFSLWQWWKILELSWLKKFARIIFSDTIASIFPFLLLSLLLSFTRLHFGNAHSFYVLNFAFFHHILLRSIALFTLPQNTSCCMS